MAGTGSIRIPWGLAAPLAGLIGLTLLAAAWPAAAAWTRQPAGAAVPYVLFGGAAVLGAVFTQTRITYLALHLGLSTLLLRYAFFMPPATGDQGQVLILLCTLSAPPLAAVCYRLNERGLFTPYGMARSLAVLVVLLFLFLLPLSAGVQAALRASPPPALHTVAGALRLPGLGLLAFLGALPFLLTRRRGESPRLGALLALALAVYFLGLNFQSSLWPAARQPAVLVLFSSAAALVLIGAILESVWMHMNIDELTELPGRRPLRHRLRCLGPAYVIAVTDLDRFKAVNDTYGHVTGDQVLRFVASVLARSAAGTVYRYGGEEFVIVYETDRYPEALADLERLREAVSQKTFAIRGEDRPVRKPRRSKRPAARQPATIQITVSIGAARAGARLTTPQAVMEAADKALYDAKAGGRNRVCHVK
jgi:diguanylate cyclase (GGDEF)-like protein